MEEVFYNGSITIRTSDADQTSFVVNGYRLKFYHRPLSKQEFFQNAQQNPRMELIDKGNPMLASPFN